MIVGIENKKTIKQKTLKEWIYFYYDKNSYLELLSLLQKSGLFTSKKYLNLDLYSLDDISNIEISQKTVIWKLNVKNLWLSYDLFPKLNFFLIK